MLATYHTHTDWSDGQATMEEMVVAALEQGVGEIGFSDHLCVYPDGRSSPSWSLAPERVGKYVDSVLEMREKFGGGISIRLGLELDWFTPSTSEKTNQALIRVLQPILGEVDYLVGSVHHVDEFCIDGSAGAWEKRTAEECDAIHLRYWELVRDMARAEFCDIAAHLDLPKKFGFLPRKSVEGELDLHISAALEAIAEAGIVVEIHTAGWHKPVRDAYPTLDILHRCRTRDIRVTLSSDAHHPDHLLRDFSAAADRLAQAGYTEVARFSEGGMRMESLEEAVVGLSRQTRPAEIDRF